MTELITFQHIVTNQVYCWNGEYPVMLLSKGDVWSPIAEVTDKELDTFKALEGTKKKSFELKGRGKFTIIHRIKVET